MNETVTEGFRYTLFALETLREERTIGEVGDMDSPFIVDNSTSFDFEWFDQLKNTTYGTSQKSIHGHEVGTGASDSFLSVDNSTNFDLDQLKNTSNNGTNLDSSIIVDNSTTFNFDWFDQLRNSTKGNSQERISEEDIATGVSESSPSVENSTGFDFEWFDELKNNTDS